MAIDETRHSKQITALRTAAENGEGTTRQGATSHNDALDAFRMSLQYGLLGVSLVGSLIALVIPHNLLGLVGFFPIAIGIKELLNLRKQHTDDDNDDIKIVNRLNTSRWRAYLPFLLVATVTFSGGEEIGIYTSIFVIYNGVSEIIAVFTVVMILTGVWCAIAHYLVNRSFVSKRLRCIANKVLPFVLIGLGAYILIEAFFVRL